MHIKLGFFAYLAFIKALKPDICATIIGKGKAHVKDTQCMHPSDAVTVTTPHSVCIAWYIRHITAGVAATVALLRTLRQHFIGH